MSAYTTNGSFRFQGSRDPQQVFLAARVAPPLLKICEQPARPFNTNGLQYGEARGCYLCFQLLGAMELRSREVLQLASDVDVDTFSQIAVHNLCECWIAQEVSAVAMEATSIYWVPVWNVLERAGFHLLLINPEHYRAIRGKKTDLKDGERIAELLQDGRLEGSFVPSTELRVLRDQTRYRVELVEHQSTVVCSIQKLLEQCNIKLGSVASNVLGVSGTGQTTSISATFFAPPNAWSRDWRLWDIE
jgi:hypothetical protein